MTRILASDLVTNPATTEAELGLRRHFIAWSERGYVAVMPRHFEVASSDDSLLLQEQ